MHTNKAFKREVLNSSARFPEVLYETTQNKFTMKNSNFFMLMKPLTLTSYKNAKRFLHRKEH